LHGIVDDYIENSKPHFWLSKKRLYKKNLAEPNYQKRENFKNLLGDKNRMNASTNFTHVITSIIAASVTLAVVLIPFSFTQLKPLQEENVSIKAEVSSIQEAIKPTKATVPIVIPELSVILTDLDEIKKILEKPTGADSTTEDEKWVKEIKAKIAELERAVNEIKEWISTEIGKLFSDFIAGLQTNITKLNTELAKYSEDGKLINLPDFLSGFLETIIDSLKSLVATSAQ
jgi:DNA repair exonuclease SbcCD ATPase subunit